jgi:hypothetical protein
MMSVDHEGTEMNGTDDMPAVFMPDDEPYLGIKSLMWFDRIICWCLAGNQSVSRWTREIRDRLTQLQSAACQIIPQGIGIALSIRELLRQAYLFPALVLVRPLIERAAVISYLHIHPEALGAWESGWRHGERPSLAVMMQVMAGTGTQDDAQKIVSAHNHIVHGDPLSCYHNLVNLPDGDFGYATGKMLEKPDLYDEIAMETQCYLIVLGKRMAAIFPEVHMPRMVEEPEDQAQQAAPGHEARPGA